MAGIIEGPWRRDVLAGVKTAVALWGDRHIPATVIAQQARALESGGVGYYKKKWKKGKGGGAYTGMKLSKKGYKNPTMIGLKLGKSGGGYGIAKGGGKGAIKVSMPASKPVPAPKTVPKTTGKTPPKNTKTGRTKGR